MSIKSIDLVSTNENLNYADLNDEGLSNLSLGLIIGASVCGGLALIFALVAIILLAASNNSAKSAEAGVEMGNVSAETSKQ